MWKGECRVRVFPDAGSGSLLRWAAPPRSWERRLGSPGKLPQLSGPGLWQGEGVARRQLGHSQPREPRQTASSPPHPQCQLQKVGRAPARARLGELPAPHWDGRSKGRGPTLHLGPSTHTQIRSPQPSCPSAGGDDSGSGLSPSSQGRWLWLAEGEAYWASSERLPACLPACESQA